MNSSRNNNSDSDGERRSPVRSALRYAFVPRIGRNVGEIGHTMGLFPRMLANIFVMQGLFPSNHPALRDPSMRLKMTDVVSAAYSRVQWTKEGLPKALFFIAVVASVIFSVIAFGFAIMGFFAAPAHAAGIFTAPDPGTDLSNNWLEHVFNGANFTVQVPTYGAGFGATAVTIPQTFGGGAAQPAGIFRTLAAMYSNAMLVLAVIIVVYHLLSMIVHTAHDGTPMGKGANHIWAPVRFVFALGLLVPVAGGFSSGQWLVMWLAKQGSGLASNVWGSPGVGGNFVQLGTRAVSKPDTQPAAMIDQLYAIGYCAKTKQMMLSSDRGYYIGNNGAPAYPAAQNATPAQAQDVTNALVMSALAPSAAEITGKGKVVAIAGAKIDATPGVNSKYYYPTSEIPPLPSGNFETAWADQSCGSVMFPSQAADVNSLAHPEFPALQAVNQAHVAAFNAIEVDALQLGATMAARRHRREGGNGLNTFGQPANPANGSGIQISLSRQALMNAYRAAYQASIAGYGGPGTLVYDVNSDRVMYTPPLGTAGLAGNAGLGGAGDLGWMSAGGYFVSMATKTGRFANATLLQAQVSACDSVHETDCPAREALDALNAQTRQEEARNAAIAQNTGGGDTLGGFVAWLNGMAMDVLELVGLANPQGQLMWHTIFGSPYPLSDMINLGEQLVDAAFMCLYIGMGLMVLGGLNGMIGDAAAIVTNRIGSGAGTGNSFMSRASTKVANFFSKGTPLGLAIQAGIGALGAVAPAFFAFASMLIIPGVMLFYLLPMLPFLNFLTGIITWMVSLLQAVVAIPIIAIAHLTPSGEGLPSASARGAYTMMLQIFLRPVMMIFGLIVCVLIINTGIGLLNGLFFNIFKQTLGGNSPGFFFNLIMFMLYAGACWSIVNAATTAIDDLPLKAVTWIGGGQGVDTNHDFSSTSQILAGAVAAKSFGAISSTAQGLASAPGGMMNQLGGAARTATTNRNADTAAATAAQDRMRGQRADVNRDRIAADPGAREAYNNATPTQQIKYSTGREALPGTSSGANGGPSTPSGTVRGGEGTGPFPIQPRTPGGSSAAGSIRAASPRVPPVTGGGGSASSASVNSATNRLLGMAGGAATLGAINSASERYGVPADYMLLKAQQESGFNPHARAGTSSATGLYQFLDQTWLGTFKRHGGDLGAGGAELASHIHQSRNGTWHVDEGYRQQVFALRENAAVAAQMGAAFAADNARDLQRAGIEVNNTTLYAAHFLGSAGAVQFMRGVQNDPNGSAAANNRAAAAANHNVFYHRNGTAKTNAEVYGWMQDRMGGPGSGGGTTVAGGPAPQGGVASQEQPQMQQISALQALTLVALGSYGASLAPGGIAPNNVDAGQQEAPVDGQPSAEQQEAPKNEPGMVSTIGHGVLGVLSFIPGVSVVAGGIDAAWYTAEGDYVNAGLAAASMIPGGKWVTTGGKLIYRGARLAGAGVRMSRVAARTGAVGLKMARAAGSMARQMRFWGAFGGGGGGGGGPVKEDGDDWYMMYLTKKALDYTSRKGKKPASEGGAGEGRNLGAAVGLNS